MVKMTGQTFSLKKEKVVGSTPTATTIPNILHFRLGILIYRLRFLPKCELYSQ